METIINDRYQLQDELSQGGICTEGRARLLSEARTIAKLSHPSIVTVFDVVETEDSPIIVMEYIEGANLYEQPPEGMEEIIAIARQLCMVLEHAHHTGISHRNLKLENIILTSDATVKLMDFGLARSVASRLSADGPIVGTVFYLTADQVLGQGIVHHSNIYSLGILLHELTTGELPFVADDPIAVITQHVHAPVVPPRAKNNQIPSIVSCPLFP